MKALFIVTGRGIGGDAVTALNIAHALENYGVECEFALDHTAPGLLFKKHGLDWHKISVPQAGGHAATKFTLAKAAFKTSKATWEAAKLCREIHPQVVVGVIGGGAVVGCLAGKLTGIPVVGILITPADAKVCTRIATTIALPESNLFHMELENQTTYKAYSPVNPEIIQGDREKALEMMPPEFDENRPTILFSSGSSLFKKMADGAAELSKSGMDANILVVGAPLEEEYLELLEGENIINLGYISWIRDLYKLVDIVVVTDDGMMIQEAIALKIPVVALLGVKWGRYHDLASVFKGAVLESEVENIEEVTQNALDNLEKMKDCTQKYSEGVLGAADRIARIIKDQIK
jgi:UDP-N-acetylglucosamine--N-acetylmuramyl-(pentapeptide) pyrophosphoryl-undecaprenol N-acetylglucosamine transferase